MPVTLATNALTSLERVKEQGSGIRPNDPTADAQLTFLINDASTQMMQYANREFKSVLVGSQARTFELRRNDESILATIDFGQWDATSISAVTVETQPTGGNISLNAAILQYQGIPIEQWYGVYSGVTIYSPTGAWGYPYLLGIKHTASVTGIWGWPSVPPDVESMCVECVLEWYRSGYAVTNAIGIPGEIDQPNSGPRHVLPWSVKQGLDRYRDGFYVA
jgi:hypothetical protein